MAVYKTMLRAVLAAVGVAIAAAACPAGQSPVRYPGFDVMPGMNLASIAGLSETACRAACDRNSRCNSAVRLVRAGGAVTCYLKTGDVSDRVRGLNKQNESQAVINARFTLLGCQATRSTGACPAGTTFKRFQGFDIDNGDNLDKISPATEAQCNAACASNSACKSSVFVLFANPRMNSCYLKTESVDSRIPVDSVDEIPRFSASGCATNDGTVTPVEPVCNASTCIGGTSGGSNKCAGSGIVSQVLGCCGANFACFQITEDFAQCRNTNLELPDRFSPVPLPCGAYGDEGPIGEYV